MATAPQHQTPAPRPELTDADLVERARGGDYDAFETLVKRHDRRLYNLAMGIVRQPQDAEEVVQNAFLAALEHLGGFRGEAAFSTWLVRIATHAALKVLRKRRGLDVVSLDAATDPDDEGAIAHPEYIADWRENPAQNAERSELRAQLTHAIDQLSEGHRLVFLLRDVEGLSVKETAEVLSLSVPNVKVRLLRARLALREELTRAFGDPSRRVAPHDHGSHDLHRQGDAEGGSRHAM
ncbi:MAG: sigma-70 family RNA polymerase sigma factor [Thermoanaerobaculia bacterium]|nr:sigma-70 family RNA polymerase sigma factor [Thermoanaerobaculia bacterium]